VLEFPTTYLVLALPDSSCEQILIVPPNDLRNIVDIAQDPRSAHVIARLARELSCDRDENVNRGIMRCSPGITPSSPGGFLLTRIVVASRARPCSLGAILTVHLTLSGVLEAKPSF
jgi:hypothetical protein